MAESTGLYSFAIINRTRELSAITWRPFLKFDCEFYYWEREKMLDIWRRGKDLFTTTTWLQARTGTRDWHKWHKKRISQAFWDKQISKKARCPLCEVISSTWVIGVLDQGQDKNKSRNHATLMWKVSPGYWFAGQEVRGQTVRKRWRLDTFVPHEENSTTKLNKRVTCRILFRVFLIFQWCFLLS